MQSKRECYFEGCRVQLKRECYFENRHVPSTSELVLFQLLLTFELCSIARLIDAY